MMLACIALKMFGRVGNLDVGVNDLIEEMIHSPFSGSFFITNNNNLYSPFDFKLYQIYFFFMYFKLEGYNFIKSTLQLVFGFS